MAERALRRVLGRELITIVRQPSYLFLLFGAPALAWVLLGGIVSTPAVQAVPFAVVDEDNSPASRDLAYRLNSSPTLDVSVRHDGSQAALAEVRAQHSFGYLVIPHGFAEQLQSGLPQQIPAYVNQQSYMMGTLLTNQLVRFVIESSLHETASQFVVHGQTAEQARAQVVPISGERSVAGNQWLNYQSFLRASLHSHVWHVLLVLSTLYAVGREFREGSTGDWWYASDRHLGVALLGKLLPLVIVMLGWALCYHLAALQALNLPWGGRLWRLLALSAWVAAFYISASVLVMALLHNLRMALSVAAVYTLPAFAFIGVTFPVTSMGGVAHFWQSLLPVGSLIRWQDQVLHFNASLADLWPQLWPLGVVTLLFWPPAAVLLREKIAHPKWTGHF
ncbi:ABC transporter permease [Saccharospirillum mangrovi]|uniref:ABC transporter permease n=1 Tax=Saccharospirillum mangrovi TaxID=2161747 RepID=UPI000D3D7B0C|nr:ABC transporter permease [Saccharospirillum mangrovi]